MTPSTFGELVSLVSLVVAAFSVFSATWVRSKGASAQQQRLSDQLESIARTCSETREDVREISRKLDDHGERLAKCEERIQGLAERLERVEAARGLGGTD